MQSWGPLHLRARRRGDGRGGARGGARRHDLRRADRARGRARGGDRRRGPVGRARAARLVGHRGGDVRGPARARVHAPRPRDQVRRLLPRPRRPVPRERRLGARDARHSERRRACRRASPPTRSSASTTTSTASPRRSSATARASRRSSSSRSPGTWAACRRRPGFLEALRLLCDASGALLVFDEVITGFRVARGGAQELFGVDADLTVLGKIVGGGLPLAAFGGRADVMERARAGRRRLPGGHAEREPARDRRRPLGAAAAARPRGLRRARAPLGAARRRARAVRPRAAGRRDADAVRRARRAGRAVRASSTPTLYGELFRGLLDRGVYVAPSQYECLFPSLAHGDEEIDETIEAVGDVLGR